MKYSNCGCAYLDLTFLTAADFVSLIGGDAVNVSKSVYDNAKDIALCGKPLYAIMPVIATPPTIGGVDYLPLTSPTYNDGTCAFSTIINGTSYTLNVDEHSGHYYSITISK